MSENKTLTHEDISRLKELVGKASKGPWQQEDEGVVDRHGEPVVSCWAESCVPEENRNNAAYIAAFNPVTGLALIAAWEDHVEALAAALTLVTIRTADMGEALTRATSAERRAGELDAENRRLRGGAGPRHSRSCRR